MEIIGCGKGHYYNPDLYSSCPECAKEQQGHADVLGATEPVDFSKYANIGSIGVTEPVGFGGYTVSDVIPNTKPEFGGVGGVDNFGATEPVNGGQSRTLETDYFREPVSSAPTGGGKVQDYGVTMPVIPSGIDSSFGSVQFQPVVGWLVCIDGPAKGRDYRIHGQYNYIGRGHHMDICISGDDCISTDRAAVIAYDAVEKFFSFGPSMGHNVVRVNGRMLMNAVVLEPYDELTIGKTKLLFIPLCGERFDWNEEK